MFKKMGKKARALGTIGLATVGAVSGQAATLTENITIDMVDAGFVFGGLLASGVIFYGMRKTKALLGA